MVYEKLHLANHESVRHVQNLWKAVINQAFCDLKINSDRKLVYKVLRRKARIWLTTNSQDFIDVCGYAGFDPQYIREKAIKVINDLPKNLKQ